MPFVITPIQNISDKQQKNDIEFSPRADSGIHSPASSIQQSLRSPKLSPYENRALFPLSQLQSQILPMTPTPRQPHYLPNQYAILNPPIQILHQTPPTLLIKAKPPISQQKS